MLRPWAVVVAAALAATLHRRCGVLLVSSLASAESSSALSQCDVESATPICLGDEQVLLPPALPDGLQGYWSFDDDSPVDLTGNLNHGLGRAQAGPSFAGVGSSALFDGSSFLVIPGRGPLRLQDFSYTFWLYLIDDTASGVPRQGLRVCTVVRKGLEDIGPEGRQPAAAPAVLFDRESRRVRISLVTVGEGSSDVSEIESFDSNSRLSRGRWFHLAIVRLNDQRMTRLYINGVLDASHPSKGFVKANGDPIYVGGDPLSRDEWCNMPMYLDELKVYNRPLVPDEIQAEAAPLLAGVEPSFVRLSCMQCTLQTAMQNCPEGYHICNSLELHVGGYQVARSLGWLQGPGTHVWSHSPVANALVQTRGGFIPGRGSTSAPAPVIPSSPSASLAESPAGSPAPAPAPMGAQLGLGICCADGA